MKLVKKDLVWAYKLALMEMVQESSKIKGKEAKMKAIKYINEKFSPEKVIKVLTESVRKKGKILTEAPLVLSPEKVAALNAAKNKQLSVNEPTIVDTAVQGAKDLGAGVKQTVTPVVNYVKDVGGAGLKGASQAAQNIGGQVQRGLANSGGAIAKGIGQIPGSQGVASIAGAHPEATTALTIAGLAALAAGAGYIYKRFLTAAGRSCAGKSGNEKVACIKQFRVKGIQEAIKKLMIDKNKCKSTSNPQVCGAVIDRKIMKWQAKLAKVSAA